jgi:hypothetical protein
MSEQEYIRFLLKRAAIALTGLLILNLIILWKIYSTD